jgi:hypothetical protein
VRLGKPEEFELTEFNKLDVDGITVYLHKTLEKFTDSPLEIDLEGLMFYHKLILRGLPVVKPGYC